jgi:putative ABC transport system permease protein
MSLIDALRHRLRVWVNPRAHERELEEELEFHLGLERMQQEHAAHGTLSERDAHLAAKRQLGNITYYKEETRRAAGLGLLDDLRSDVRFALRSFRRTPGFTAIAVLTLAVGIGANTAIFSAVDALLLRPLPFPEPDRLVAVNITAPPREDRPATNDIGWSYPKFEMLREIQPIFGDLTAFFSTQFTIRIEEDAFRESGEFIDSRYLPTLGIKPALGRNFLAQEDYLGGPRNALLSDAFWQRMFNADSGVLGRTMTVDGSPYTIVGVLPDGFRGMSSEASFWIPVGAGPSASWQTSVTRDVWNHMYRVVGRLRPDVSLERAKTVMAQLGTQVDTRFPVPPRVGALHLGATVRPLDALRVDPRIRRMLFVLVGAVGLVLLIACANVANLLLVRASGRRPEIAVRLAMGAGRGRLVRQLLVESLVLALAGGAASLVIAWAGVKALGSLELASVLEYQRILGLGGEQTSGINLDMTAFAFTATLAIATGLVFGLVPALQSTRFSVTNVLKGEGGPTIGGLRRLTSRNALVVMEIALAIILLAGSGLMLRTLGELIAVRPGFDAEHVMTMRVNRAPDWARDSITRFYDVALERLSALPGVTSVGIADCPPLSRGCYDRAEMMRVDGPDRAAPMRTSVGAHWITPDWPRTMRVPLLAGRLLTRADDAKARRVVLVNESAARRLWPGESPIDRPVVLNVDHFSHDTAYVAGVIGDVRFGSIDSLPQPDVYVSYFQSPLTYRMMFFLRTRADPSSIAQRARFAIRAAAPGFPVYDVESMQDRVVATTAQPRFIASLLGAFAGLALLLAAIGTYGVISFGVAQRTKEIGVRVALGATRGHVVRLIVGQGIALAVVGIVCGLAGAIAATRVMGSLLYGVEPTDPATLFGIVGMLIAAVLAASWIPARRAAGVPAVQALRGR